MMLALLLAASFGLTEIDALARQEAEERLEAAVLEYVAASMAGSDTLELRRTVSVRAIALHAIYERDRMRQIDLAIDIQRLRRDPAADSAELQRLELELANLREVRERYLFRHLSGRSPDFP